MSPLPSPIMPSPQFHVKMRQLKLANIDQVKQVNVHENGLSLNTSRVDSSSAVDEVNLQWADAEQLYIALANALTLRNINGWR